MKLILKETADKIAASARNAMEHIRDVQVLQQFMKNRISEIDLSAAQKRKLERYQYIYNARVSGKYVDKDIVHQLQQHFKIEINQAYLDLRAADELFTTIINIDKRFNYYLMLQLNSDYQRKCLDMGDMKSLAKFEKNRADILKQIEDLDEGAGELFEGHEFEVTFDPTLLGAKPISKKEMTDLLKQINEKRNKKINTNLIESLEFEEATPSE